MGVYACADELMNDWHGPDERYSSAILDFLPCSLPDRALTTDHLEVDFQLYILISPLK